jgi:hypothetical protein
MHRSAFLSKNNLGLTQMALKIHVFTAIENTVLQLSLSLVKKGRQYGLVVSKFDS